MQSIFQEISVHYRYPVHFTRELFSPKNSLLKDVIVERTRHLPAKLFFVLDQGVIDSHKEIVEQIKDYCSQNKSLLMISDPLVLPGGEEIKNDTLHLNRLHNAVDEYHLDRHCYIVAVGGGSVLDMTGYAAATAHRGIRFIRVPTTTLAQNDSGVGVKNGINAFGKKNFLGTFQPPFAVLNDSNFLKSLTLRVWRSGIAEAVKVSLIKDPEFFSFLEQNSTKLCERDLPGMEHLVYRCAELHLNHIAKGGDPFEQGSSRPLDFGHWAAHKLEQLTHHRLLHGEAVAIGIAIDSTYSYLTGLLSKQSWERVIKLLSRLGFELHVPEMNDPNSLLSGLEEFREHLGGELTIMLLKDIGTGVEVNKVDTEKLVESIKLLYTV